MRGGALEAVVLKKIIGKQRRKLDRANNDIRIVWGNGRKSQKSFIISARLKEKTGPSEAVNCHITDDDTMVCSEFN